MLPCDAVLQLGLFAAVSLLAEVNFHLWYGNLVAIYTQDVSDTVTTTHAYSIR
jgi:hypothetical protein